MSPRAQCISIAILAALGGAAAGVQAWQYFMWPHALTAAASEITTDLLSHRSILESLDRKDIPCAEKKLVDVMEASLTISVPGALEWRIDERFRERLQTTAVETRRYLESRQREGHVAECGDSRSNPSLNTEPLKRPG